MHSGQNICTATTASVFLAASHHKVGQMSNLTTRIMQTKQSEEPRALSLQEMEETCGGGWKGCASQVISGVGLLWGAAGIAAGIASGGVALIAGAVALALSVAEKDECAYIG